MVDKELIAEIKNSVNIVESYWRSCFFDQGWL